MVVLVKMNRTDVSQIVRTIREPENRNKFVFIKDEELEAQGTRYVRLDSFDKQNKEKWPYPPLSTSGQKMK